MIARSSMMASIQAQLYRLIHHKRFWLCVLCTVIFTALLVLGLWLQVQYNAFSRTGIDEKIQFSIFTTTLRTSTQNPSALDALYGGLASKEYCGIFLILFASVFTAMDFTSKTIHLSVSAGKSRLEVYLGKLVAVIIGCEVIALTYILTLFVSGGLFFGFSGYGLLAGGIYLLRTVNAFLLFSAVSGIAIHFAAILIRHEAFALVGLLIVSKVYYLVILKWLYTSKELGQLGQWIYNFTPEFQMLKTANRHITSENIGIAALIALFYAALLVVAGMGTFKKRDL